MKESIERKKFIEENALSCKIEFINSKFMENSFKVKFDVILLQFEFSKNKNTKIEELIKTLIKACSLSKNIILILPKEFELNEIPRIFHSIRINSKKY